MKCYVILREYYNNVSVVEEVYSSKKKAQGHIDNIKHWCDKDGWSVTNKARYMSSQEGYVPCIEIQAPSGNTQSIERYYVIAKELK